MNHLLRLLVRFWPLRKGRQRVWAYATRRTRGVVVAPGPEGTRLILDLENAIDNALFLDGAHEVRSLQVLKHLMDRNHCRTFLDIGANLGTYSTAVSTWSGVKAIHAFEPDPRNRAQLLGNLCLNRCLDRTVVHDCALSDVTGSADFFLSRRVDEAGDFGKLNTGTSSLSYLETRHSNATSIAVPVQRLDDLLDISGEVVALKVDVEGHEAPVLRGMSRFLAENRCILLVEIWSDRVEEPHAFLTGLGYERIEAQRLGSTLELDNHVYLKRGLSV